MIAVFAPPPCAIPYSAAAVEQQAAAVYPQNAERREGAIAVVRIAVGPDGHVLRAEIQKSTFDVALDMAAIDAARRSTYVPEIVQCKPVAGYVTIRVPLDPRITAARPLPCIQSSLAAGSSSQTGPYLTKEQILRTLRLGPGDRLIDLRREPYAELQKETNDTGCDPMHAPSQQVWVFRIHFSRPQWFTSAKFASGVFTTAVDARSGAWIETTIHGKFLSGPFGHANQLHPRRCHTTCR